MFIINVSGIRIFGGCFDFINYAQKYAHGLGPDSE